MTLSTKLKTGLRAGVVALALGGSALMGAAPAQAAIGFNLSFGNGPFMPGPGVVLRFGSPNYFNYCKTNNQIRAALRSNGYSNVDIVREMNSSNKVWAVGRKHGVWYELRVDRCTGKVDRVSKVDRLRNGSFNFSFSF